MVCMGSFLNPFSLWSNNSRHTLKINKTFYRGLKFQIGIGNGECLWYKKTGDIKYILLVISKIFLTICQYWYQYYYSTLFRLPQNQIQYSWYILMYIGILKPFICQISSILWHLNNHICLYYSKTGISPSLYTLFYQMQTLVHAKKVNSYSKWQSNKKPEFHEPNSC